MNNLWQGGWETHRVELKRSWLRERLRLLFKRSSTDNKEEKKDIESQLKELDKKYSKEKRDSGYCNYLKST